MYSHINYLGGELYHLFLLLYHFEIGRNRLFSQLTCKEQSQVSNELVEGDCCIKWDVSVERGLAQFGDKIPAHCDQETRVCKHHGTGSPTCHRHTIACNLT